MTIRLQEVNLKDGRQASKFWHFADLESMLTSRYWGQKVGSFTETVV